MRKPDDRIVQIAHNGKLSDEIPLATATAAAIQNAFKVAQDETYSGVTATVVSTSSTQVVWDLQLVTPWASCANARSFPLLGTKRMAKVSSVTTLTAAASCLSGGVDLALGPTSTQTTFLPWDASEHVAAERINTLFTSSDSEGKVKVYRSGDGQSSAIFTVTFLGTGRSLYYA